MINQTPNLTGNIGVALMAIVMSTSVAVADDASERGEFLKAHCVKCHGPDAQEGEVRLDDMPTAAVGLEVAARWERVREVLEAESMPPEDEPAVRKDDRQRMWRRCRSTSPPRRTYPAANTFA